MFPLTYPKQKAPAGQAGAGVGLVAATTDTQIIHRCVLDKAYWVQFIRGWMYPLDYMFYPTLFVGMTYSGAFTGEPTILELPSGRATLAVSGPWTDVVLTALTTGQIAARGLTVTVRGHEVEVASPHPGSSQFFEIASDASSPMWRSARRGWTRFRLPVRC